MVDVDLVVDLGATSDLLSFIYILSWWGSVYDLYIFMDLCCIYSLDGILEFCLEICS